MINRLKIWGSSKPWFWKLRTWLGKAGFVLERRKYKSSASVTKAKESARILGSFTWIDKKSLLLIMLILTILVFLETYVRNNFTWLKLLSVDDKKFNIEQLRLYAQILAAVFSIYFATIGIILSAGYTRLRRDIIQMLTNEQVGSVYAKALVFAAMFCLAATALPLIGFDPGVFVNAAGMILTVLSVFALFPLGQRLFNFFNLNQLVRSEILPSIARHIEGAASRRNSISLANHHSKVARQALEQLSYIDERIKVDKEGLEHNLPALNYDYTILLLHYLQKKHTINQESYWFPRLSKHRQWFFAGDIETSLALKTSSQLQVEERVDYAWFENEIADRLAGHIELAFQVGNLELALKLISNFSVRISAYAAQFQFDIGMQEVKKFKKIIEKTLLSSDVENAKVIINIADAWAKLGSSLCLETLRRIITFEGELKQFFEEDEWSEKSLRSLPTFLQVELAFIVERIEFEQEIEGQRLSKPKYVRQLAVQKLLQHYAKILPAVCDFYQSMVPDFVETLLKIKMSKAATQVVLASLHNHWKLPRWLDEIDQLVARYDEYEHYTEKHYELPKIEVAEMSKQLPALRDDAVVMLSSGDMIGHIFEPKHNDELPDHFGQVYFELAEACISAMEQNDPGKLDKVLPMFLSLTFITERLKFSEQSLDINEEYRLHLSSSVINDLAAVIGFAMLYAEYFDNAALSENALTTFDAWIEKIPDKQQYLKRMVCLSNPNSFSMSASPRSQIRFNWKVSFERRARADGFGDQVGGMRGNQHPNQIVREFMRSRSDPSHLFFAKHIIPQINPLDFDVDYRITNLVRRLSEEHEEVHYEDF